MLALQLLLTAMIANCNATAPLLNPLAVVGAVIQLCYLSAANDAQQGFQTLTAVCIAILHCKFALACVGSLHRLHQVYVLAQ